MLNLVQVRPEAVAEATNHKAVARQDAFSGASAVQGRSLWVDKPDQIGGCAAAVFTGASAVQDQRLQVGKPDLKLVVVRAMECQMVERMA